MAYDLLGSLDDFEDGVALAGTDVVDMAGSGLGSHDGAAVSIGEVVDVDVIAYAGSVRSVIVLSEHSNV